MRTERIRTAEAILTLLLAALVVAACCGCAPSFEHRIAQRLATAKAVATGAFDKAIVEHAQGEITNGHMQRIMARRDTWQEDQNRAVDLLQEMALGEARVESVRALISAYTVADELKREEPEDGPGPD